MNFKFRAWNKDEKKILPVWQMWFPKNGEPRAMVKSQKTGKFLINEFPLMQFTGLKDKNGKEIYEGDILESDNENFATGVVVYDNGRFAIKKPNGKIIAYDYTIWTAYEVIGNIYENPELLEEKL